MATVLGFSIISRYSGGGVAQARRDLAMLRAQMATLNGDLQRHTTFLNGIPARWRAIGAAAVSVAPAMIPISAAALQVAASFTAMSVAVGAALGVYGAAMKGAITQTMEMAKAGKKLSPVQKEFVGSVNGMKKAWADFIKQTSGQTLSTATNVVKGLTAGIAELKPIIDAIHPALLQVSKDFDNWMRGESASEYADIIARIAKQALPQLIAAGKAVLNVLGDGFRAFAPLAEGTAASIRRGAEALQRWSDGGGFQRFLEYVKQNAPAVRAFWQAFGAALTNVFNILKGFSGGALSVLTDALRGIAAIDPSSVKAFAQALLLMKSPLLFLVLNCPPLRDAMIALLGAMNPATIYAIAGAFVAMRVAILLMNAGLVSTPVGWVIIALAGLAAAIVWVATKTTWFQTAWQYVWNFMKEVGAWFAGPFVNFFKAIGAWFAGPFAQFFITVWNGIKTGFQAVINFFVTAWNTVSGALVTAWNTVWNGIATAVHAVWTGLTTAWNAVVSGLATAWSTVSGALVTAWNFVWNGLRTAAQAVWTGLQVAWNAFTSALSTAWTAVSGALVTAWNFVWNSLKTAAEFVWNALKAAWSLFITSLQTVWTAVSTALTTAWNFVWNALKTAAQAIWTAMQAAWNLFITTLQTIWNTVSAVLRTAWQAFWTFIKSAAELVWNALKTAWQALWTAMTTAWNTFKAMLQAAWTAFWNLIKAAADLVWNALKTAWQALWTALTTAWNAFKALLQAAWSAFWEAIKTAATTIWDAIRAAWDGFFNAVKTVWEGFKGFFSDAWNAFWEGVKTTASNIWDKIKEVVAGAVNKCIDIINGIIGAWNTITGAIGLDSLNIDKVGHVSFAVGGVVGDMPHFAVGGTVDFSSGGGALGGYAPGRDTVPAMLSRGEGVLTPEAVRGLGGPGFVHSANRTFAGHRGAGRGAAPLSAFGFDQGGTVQTSAMGSTLAWHRSGGDVGWSFAVGGLPSEIPVPDPDGPKGPSTGGGTVGQKPENSKEKDGSILDRMGLGVVGDAIGNAMDFGGMILGFIGEAAIRAAFNAVTGLIDGFGGFGPFGEMLKGMLNKLKEGMIDNLIKRDQDAKKEYESMAVAGAQSVQAWAPLAAKALQLAGLAPSQLGAFLALMQAESGGNPNAINGWDINAKNGVPSQGLMQVIPPTFAAYHVAGTSNNILDPLANMAASANYIKHRYGGSVPGSPYANGTPGATRGTHLVGEEGPELVNFAGGETVTPAGETSSILSGMGGMAAGGGMAGGIAGMLQGIMGSGATPEEMIAQFEQIIAAAQMMATQVKTSWGMVTTSATTTQAGLAPVVSDIVAKHQTEIPTALNTMTTANATAWTGMSTTTSTQWTALRDGTYAEAGQYMGTQMPTWGQEMNTGVSTAWSDMSVATATQWKSMEQGTAEPVNWIIANPYNNGIAAMWNAVAGVIWEGGGRELPTVSGFASGGRVSGPGTGTSDSVPAMLSKGEHVLTAKEVRKAGGHQAIYRMRSNLLAGAGQVAGFAAGGAVDGEIKRGNMWPAIEGTMRSAVSDTKSQLTDLFGRTGGSADILSPADWIEQYVKKDDELNKFVGGPPWIPGVSDAITSWGGVTVNQRTADMLNAAMALGFSGSATQGSFSTGVAASAGTHDGGGVVDLVPATSGNIGALRAVGFAAWGRGPEWGSPSFSSHIHAVALGDPTVSPGAAAQQASFLAGGNGLADGGPDNFSGGIPAIAYKEVDPADIKQNVVSYDQGGLLQPGYTLAYNGTGKPEPVGHDLEPRGSRKVEINMPVTIHGSANANDVVDGINSQVLPKLRQMLSQGTGSN